MESTYSSAPGQAFVEKNPGNREKPFPRIYNQRLWLDWLQESHPGLAPSSRFVLVTLIGHTDVAGCCFPSLGRLAELTGYGVKAIRAAIAEAVKLKILRCEARFDHERRAGGRQTSNRYEFLLFPGAALPKGTQAKDGGNEDAGDRHEEREHEDDGHSNEEHPENSQTVAPEESAEAGAPDESPAAVGQIATQTQEPESKTTLLTPPLASRESPPSPEIQGVKISDGSALQKANSTHACAHETPASDDDHTLHAELDKLADQVENASTNTPAPTTKTQSTAPCPLPRTVRSRSAAGATSNAAAAVLEKLLSSETATLIKRRHGHKAFASVFRVLRRNECVAHPEISKKALSQLLAASNVRNPAGYLARVFADELEAFLQAAPATPDELEHEDLCKRGDALLEQIRILRTRLGSAKTDASRARLQAELEQIGQEYQTLRSARARLVDREAKAILATEPSSEAKDTTGTDSPEALETRARVLFERQRALLEATLSTTGLKAADRVQAELEKISKERRAVAKRLQQGPVVAPRPLPVAPPAEPQTTTDVLASTENVFATIKAVAAANAQAAEQARAAVESPAQPPAKATSDDRMARAAEIIAQLTKKKPEELKAVTVATDKPAAPVPVLSQAELLARREELRRQILAPPPVEQKTIESTGSNSPDESPDELSQVVESTRPSLAKGGSRDRARQREASSPLNPRAA